MLPSITQRLAQELNARPQQIDAAIALMDEGATVPFIARYRKEATGGLDDTQLRDLEVRLKYLRELEERRAVVLDSIDKQGKLSAELSEAIRSADNKTTLEDLYLPYKPKRRSKAQIAREAGLEPLAHLLRDDPTQNPSDAAAAFVDAEKGVADAAAALEGARHILMEELAETAELIGKLRDYGWRDGVLVSSVVEGQEEAGAKFSDYFDYSERLAEIPSHRALALFRGRNENMLNIAVKFPHELEQTGQPHPAEQMIAAQWNFKAQGRPADDWLQQTIRWAWKIKLAPHLEVEWLMRVKDSAEEEAIRVFATNLKDLLLAAPAGQRATMGLDPGLRTGVKVAVVDNTGKLLETATIYPHAPRDDWNGSLRTLGQLCAKHKVDLIAIGNGTASRETDKLVADLIKLAPELKVTKQMVSEAGASVYSASELAAREFPELDVSLRGAVSIARRLQDPLAELVKIDPKSIGVGQYQHDVNQTELARSLDAVVEDCVNAVGVDVNTASAPLLARISGLNATLAREIVAYRDSNGAFKNRLQLKQVPRLGDKTFEQAAGFLRIANGDNPLDASAVHPEAYPVVEKILAKTGKSVANLIGNSDVLAKLAPQEFTDERFGVFTVKDILKELDKPGRDPRPEFKTANFKDGVETLADLTPGMELEGVVTNVANFGAFVDIGVHQDGLVHVSALADRFIKDPHEVVKAGDIVKVRVVEVDIKRNRIALTMRKNDRGDAAPARTGGSNTARSPAPRAQQPAPKTEGAMAAAFAKLRK